MSAHSRICDRRSFLRATGSASLGAWLLAAPRADAAEKPNILWITVEDMSADLGCYGDAYAHTPNIDRLAAEGVRYTGTYATAPACSPARSCLITGLCATSLGTQRLRSHFPIPDRMTGFPSHLRKAGYYCTNNAKTDYNTANERAIIEASWDACGGKAHWWGRRRGQPFFAVFNDMTTHQSRSMVWPYEQFRQRVQSQLTPDERHDPAKAPVPPYYPDTPIIRKTIARNYDCITAMDKHVGRLLDQLERDGLADQTIVFFYSDHGAGLPRHKRALYDSGMHVPLIVRFPPRYQHLAPARPGKTVERLVSFVDFPPTVLSLAGLPVPGAMQGKPFLGPAAVEPRRRVYGARDRVDEAYDLVRSVRGPRYLYIRTYMPHLSYHQPSAWPGQGAIRQEITRLAAEGKLAGPQLAYAGPTRPAEELYDSASDPQQIHNLATSPQHQPILERMRGELRDWVLRTRDLGFLPEWEAWQRSEGTTPYEMARQSDRYPLPRILEAAELVGRGREALPRQVRLLEDSDAAVRYWAVIGLRALGKKGSPAAEALLERLDDPSPPVRIEAAAALAYLGQTAKALPVLQRDVLAEHPCVCLRAARALELLGEKGRPAVPQMKKALEAADKKGPPLDMFIRFSLEAALKGIGEAP
ncbi:MAG: sulfatase-like hydrolase/transferase [Candidatus Brocadiia bacterium]